MFSMRDDLPTGIVTLLFTDIEGSTKLLHELGPERYAHALAEHRRILRAAFDAYDYSKASAIAMVMAAIMLVVVSLVLFGRGRLYRGATGGKG